MDIDKINQPTRQIMRFNSESEKEASEESTTNKEDRRSVTGHLLCFMGVPIAWKSKPQPLCSLSSSESEYIAISELVKEVLFAKQIVEDFGYKVEVPINT